MIAVSKLFRIVFFCVLCSACLPVTSALPHPHVFIENTVQVVFDEKGITGIRLAWTLDEMFSNVIITDCDADQNGTLNQREKQNVRKTYFNNLKEYKYFSRIAVDGSPRPTEAVSDFQVTVKNGRIVYTFFVPCRIPASKAEQKVVIGVYDDTYYCDVLLVDYRCSPEAMMKNYTYRIRSEDNTEKSFYFGQISPEEIIVTFRDAA